MVVPATVRDVAAGACLCESVAKAKSLCSVRRDLDRDTLNPTCFKTGAGVDGDRGLPYCPAERGEAAEIRPLERMSAVSEGPRR